MSNQTPRAQKPAKGPLAKLPTCAVMDQILIQRVEHPENAKRIDAKIRKTFEKTVAIMVLDMSGFSRLVQRYGIIHYLAMIRRMRRVVTPAILRNHGLVIKFEADNCFAVFQKADDGVQACIEIRHDLEVANLATPDESDVHVCIGLGYGPTLLACDDMYGNEMNLASKLGEDVAEKGEVLLTEAAKKACKKKHDVVMFPLTVSGVTMKAYKLAK
ncbi:MAG TPA: adenylate/guanylate cyclase domain-containing protein [Candidatus Methylomirabilis sp.]|nr:adenylate/guanylate cyclase domain-containing protein [Candidatus Methylomirabilis sp.]